MRHVFGSIIFALFALPALAEAPTLSDLYAERLSTMARSALSDDTGYRRLGELCDRFGHRISGSATLEAAIDWAVGLMGSDGFVVHKEPVQVPVWVRGAERAEVITPQRRALTILGLGGTTATPEGGVEAEVVAVGSLDALDALPDDAVKGRIVLIDQPFTTYGETVQIRGQGAAHAAKKGAVAVLIRSVTPISLSTAHTGAMRFEEGEPTVPAAALTVEDASWMHRVLDAGQTVRVRLELHSERKPDATSYNVIADLPGREKPEEIVVLGCHIDSWDVGQGAQDDGAGCLIVWEAARQIALGEHPRRTVRVVLFTNEENGLRGGVNYAEVHAAELPRHVAAIEADTGNGPSTGFRLDLGGLPEGDPRRLRAQGLVWQLEALLAPYGGGSWVVGGAGADVGPSVAAGVPGLGLNQDMDGYWPIHHTWADTFDKIDRVELQKNVALVAATAWTLAEMPERLVEPVAPTKPSKRHK